MINISSLNNPEAGVNQLGAEVGGAAPTEAAPAEAAPIEEVLVAGESGTVADEVPANDEVPSDDEVQVNPEDVKYLMGCLDSERGLNSMFILGILIAGTGESITLTNDIVKQSLLKLVSKEDDIAGLELQAANIMCEERETGKKVPGLQLKVVPIKADQDQAPHTTGTGIVDAEFTPADGGSSADEVAQAADELAAMRAKAAARAGDNVVPMNSLAKMVLDEATPKE